MTNNKKNQVKEQLDSLDFEGNAEIIITALQTVMKNHKKDGFFEFHIEKETDYGYGYDEQYDTYYLYGIRLETDKEFKKRITDNKRKSAAARKAARTRAAEKEKKELEQYLKLHAKYGDK